MVGQQLLQVGNSLLQKYLPDTLYFQVAKYGYPLFRPACRGHNLSITIEDGLYHARSETVDYWFDSRFKVGRYLTGPAGEPIERYLRRRYSDGPVDVRPGDTVVDVGANVGEFARAVASVAQRVIAVEPDPSPFRCLERNAAAVSGITPVALGLGEAEGALDFYFASNLNNSSFIEPDEGWTHKERIPVTTLGDLMARQGLDRIDFLKLEAEGYEPEILRGAAPDLGRIARIAVDGGPERAGQPTADGCAALLRDHGFRVWQRNWMVFALNPAIEGAESGHDDHAADEARRP